MVWTNSSINSQISVYEALNCTLAIQLYASNNSFPNPYLIRYFYFSIDSRYEEAHGFQSGYTFNEFANWNGLYAFKKMF